MNALQAWFLFVALSLLLNCVVAIPIWLIWTVAGIGERLFTFLPSAWQSISLLNLMGLLLLMSLLKGAFDGLQVQLKT